MGAIANHTDVVIVADALFFGTLNDKILEESVNGVRDTVGLSSVRFTCAKWIRHGPGLVYEEEKT